jgi:hypothetical protein
MPASEAFRYQWTSFYAHSTNSLFLLSDDGASFTTHPPKKTRQRLKHPVRTFAFDSGDSVPILPPDAIPVDTWAEPNKHVITDVISSIVPTLATPPPSFTWPTYLLSLPPWEQELLGSVAVPSRPILLTALRTEDRLFLASDGGACDKKASFGALLATSEQILVECGGRATGADPGSVHTEGYGILTILRLLYHLCYFYVNRNRDLRLRLYCNSQSLLTRIDVSRALQRSSPRRYLFSEIGVEMQILAALQAMDYTVVFEHIEGHQDTKYPDRPLSWAAQLNM